MVYLHKILSELFWVNIYFANKEFKIEIKFFTLHVQAHHDTPHR